MSYFGTGKKCFYGVWRCNYSLIWVRRHYSCFVISKTRIQLSPYPLKIVVHVRVKLIFSQNIFYSLFLDIASVMILWSLGETWMSQCLFLSFIPTVNWCQMLENKEHHNFILFLFFNSWHVTTIENIEKECHSVLTFKQLAGVNFSK